MSSAEPGRRRRAGLVLAAVLLVAAGAVAAVAATAAEEDPAVTETALQVVGRTEPSGPSGAPGDGVTRLDASVFTPADDAAGADAQGRRPAVMLAHGFGGSKDDLAAQARRVAAEGYVVLTWTARGFGRSGGRIHLSSADWEIDDVSRLVDALAERDDVALDGDGDPVVGIAGASYGGAAALLGAAYDPRVDAVVPTVTWHDLEQALFPQSATPVPYGDAPAGVFKQRWAALLYGAGLGGGGRADLCGRFAPEVCRLYQRAATGEPLDVSGRRLLARSSATPSALADYSAPTLLVQGTRDSLFGLEQATATAAELSDQGVEVEVRWVEGGHDAAGLVGEDDVVDAALPWFEEHLRDDGSEGGDGDEGGEGDEVDLVLPPPALRGGEGERRTTGLGALVDPPTEALELHGDPQPVVSPPGGEPAALTTLPGTGGASDLAGALGGAYELAALPGATAVFETDPLDQDLTVAGAAEVTLSVRSTSTAGDATLFASLWVVGEDGAPRLPRALVAPVALPQGDTVDVALPTAAYRVEAGQRLRLVVASTDQAYAVPEDGRVYTVSLGPGGRLELPVPSTRAAASNEPLVAPALLGGVGGLLLLLAVGAFLALGRVRGAASGDDDPALAEVPLVVDGLVKEYRNGFRAVDGVSWRAETGQVVGLLGPNGAGKTTTMRMLVGLIGADEGSVHVLGRPLVAGSPVLGEVGALIEGPGLLPHRTGRENLAAYWAATGRPAQEAGFEEVLAVADLGAAADRPVRSYSHGMRQRLGIAQAMLGRPRLLLLDEPTNGLDPPQIAGLREVLRRYAEGGRTVVVSSHLLAEVEQTCSHVVVMHRGRVVLQGPVADLVEGSSDTVITLDAPAGAGGTPGAARLLGGLSGVTAVEAVDDTRVRVTGPAARARLVAMLVREGYGVVGVDSRRRLEEVFMGLVGGGEPAQPEEQHGSVR